MTLELFMSEQKRLNDLVDFHSDNIRDFLKAKGFENKGGLVPDEIKFSVGFVKLKIEYLRAFENLRDFNKKYAKQFSKQARDFKRGLK